MLLSPSYWLGCIERAAFTGSSILFFYLVSRAVLLLASLLSRKRAKSPHIS
jgi:hypothetical protein